MRSDSRYGQTGAQTLLRGVAFFLDDVFQDAPRIAAGAADALASRGGAIGVGFSSYAVRSGIRKYTALSFSRSISQPPPMVLRNVSPMSRITIDDSRLIGRDHLIHIRKSRRVTQDNARHWHRSHAASSKDQYYSPRLFKKSGSIQAFFTSSGFSTTLLGSNGSRVSRNASKSSAILIMSSGSS